MASIQMQAVRTATQQMTNNGMPQFGENIDPARLRAAVEMVKEIGPGDTLSYGRLPCRFRRAWSTVRKSSAVWRRN